MDRYVLAVLVNLGPKRESSFNGVAACKRLFDHLKESSSTSNYSMPACSLTGRAAPQRWYFAFQASHITTQWCSPEWEDLCPQHSESKESHPSYIESCIAAILEQEEQSMLAENPSASELFEEAAEGLHQLADKLPPPGKALLDVIMVCVDEEVGLKEMLPLIGSLKHMQSWFSANMVIVTDLIAGWKKVAAYLGARFCLPPVIESCVNKAEIWRGGLQIKEKKFVSELMFDGFCLQTQRQSRLSNLLYPQMDNQGHTEHKRQNEVFQCFQPVLELIQLVRVPDLQILLHSSTEFHLGVTSQSVKAKLLLDQLCTLRGEVGALFSLACIISSESFPAAPQLSSCKWRDLMSKHPKDLPAPDVEVKGERGQYLLLVQGAESGGCSARMIHTASQLNGSAALATLGALVADKLNSGSSAADWPGSLPYLSGEQLVQRERRLAKVQTLVLKECSRRRVEASKPYAVPVTELKALLSLARAQYLQMHDSTLPTASQSLAQTSAAKLRRMNDSWHAEWPERSVLLNYQNIQRARQKSRCRLFSSGSSESLMGPKDGHRGNATLLDARELLKHFTSDGRPSGELQSLPLLRGENAFRLSPDLTPRKVSGLTFRKASRSHYHGIEFCLDEHKALERDRSFVKLQKRLIRYETQSTCCKEPCPVPFALSPAPSPAVLSEPGSVPDGEALQSEPPRLTRRSHKPDALVQQRKRSCKSESSEALAGAGRLAALRQEASGSVTDSSPSHKPSQDPAESRSQKHNRMLREVVVKTLDKHRISSEHTCFEACSKRLFDISKFYLKDLKTSRGLHEEMKKAASNNVKQVIEWVLEKSSKR